MLRSDIEFEDILKELKENPEIKVYEIANKYGVTTRTVFNRVNSAGYPGIKSLLIAVLKEEL